MMIFPMRFRIGLWALAAASLMTMGAAPVSTNFDERILLAQNNERASLGLGLLRWNPQLAASAANWADRLAESHRFEHAREDPIVPQGENLWEGTSGYFSPEAMVNAWVKEKRYFKPGLFPDNSITGDVEDVGHFTQLAWRKTSEVGCAIASNDDYDILVCRYSQAGNYVGQNPY